MDCVPGDDGQGLGSPVIERARPRETLSATNPMNPGTLRQRPYLQLLFECCSVYQRVYKDRHGEFYQGRCPRCLRQIRFNIRPDGTPARQFVVR